MSDTQEQLSAVTGLSRARAPWTWGGDWSAPAKPRVKNSVRLWDVSVFGRDA